jgi:GR25 family glycosyltransferase involved in LPS biosynthesis
MYYLIVDKIKGFVINLDDRRDRWHDASSQFLKFPFEIKRVSATKCSDIETEERFVPCGVAATWRSHQRAMQAHLESEALHGLILEDDFVVNRDLIQILSCVEKIGDFDLVQIGFLSPSFIRRLFRHIIGLRDLFLKILQRIHEKTHLNFLNRLIITEQKFIPVNLVLNDIQAGGQAYIVSRKFSEAAQFMNNPSFLSADGMLMALSETRTFKIGRTRISFIGQSNSVSSVQQRFKSFN